MNAVPKLIPWISSKGKLADKILPLFPAHTCYVEPFAGSAALFFRKEPTKVEVLNDVNGELVNHYCSSSPARPVFVPPHGLATGYQPATVRSTAIATSPEG